MGFFYWLNRKLGNPGPGRHSLTEDDRQQGAEFNKLKWEIKRKQLEREEEIARLRDEREKARLERDIKDLSGNDDDPEPDNSDLQVLMGLLAAAQAHSPGQAVNSTQSPSPALQPALSLTDEEIDKLLASAPKPMLSAAKKMPVDVLRKLIEQKMGPLDNDTFGRAINKLRAGAFK